MGMTLRDIQIRRQEKDNLITEVECYESRLTDWEISFLDDISREPVPSERQMVKLREIYHRVS